MKKYLLPDTGHFYKANLHCHSNISDGRLSPEELKKIYKEHGYSILSITDHNLLVPHKELDDEDFLTLNGYELNVNQTGSDYDGKTHMCAIALESDNIIDPCWHRTKFIYPCERAKSHLIKYDTEHPDFIREYSGEGISRMMKTLREHGFFVTYNHPSWSLENLDVYKNYDGMNAIEIYNTSCNAAGLLSNDSHCYDDMLRNNKRIYCIAADDNHNDYDILDGRCDSFGGFVMIKADKLEYRTVTKALEDGNFYASTGPSIYELYFEDGKVYVKTSDAKRIYLTTAIRYYRVKTANVSEKINEAVFDLRNDIKYFRITVEDENGKFAYSNAYFYDELVK